MKVIHNNIELSLDLTKKVYECSVCEAPFNWSENSSWYGSYRILEDSPHKIKYFCSSDCQSKNLTTPKTK